MATEFSSTIHNSRDLASCAKKAARTRDRLRDEIATYWRDTTGFNEISMKGVRFLSILCCEFGDVDLVFYWIDCAAHKRHGELPDDYLLYIDLVADKYRGAA